MLRTALPIACLTVLLAGCGGGSGPAASAPSEDPGAGRKPASGAWLEPQYADWTTDSTSRTEGHYVKGEAYGPTAQQTQPRAVVSIEKGQNTDIRTMVELYSNGAKATDANKHGEVWCGTTHVMCYVQLNGGYLQLNGINTTADAVGALGTEIYRSLSDDPNAPVPTSTPTPKNPGAGRKPAEGKALPPKVGDWSRVGGTSLPTFGSYGKAGTTLLSQTARVQLQTGDQNARQRASMIKEAKQFDEAWCAEASAGRSMSCYVQLDGGMIEVAGGQNMPVDEVPALANALYQAL